MKTFRVRALRHNNLRKSLAKLGLAQLIGTIAMLNAELSAVASHTPPPSAVAHS